MLIAFFDKNQSENSSFHFDSLVKSKEPLSKRALFDGLASYKHGVFSVDAQAVPSATAITVGTNFGYVGLAFVYCAGVLTGAVVLVAGAIHAAGNYGRSDCVGCFNIVCFQRTDFEIIEFFENEGPTVREGTEKVREEWHYNILLSIKLNEMLCIIAWCL
jgi:hypothetical protein